MSKSNAHTHRRPAVGRREVIRRLWAASEFASYGDTETALQVVRDLVEELEQDQRDQEQEAA